MKKRVSIFILILFLFLPISLAYEINYYHNDHLGSPAVITNQNRERVYSIDYKPFGESFNEQGEDNRLTYNTKEKDSTGLHYYGARYYDSDLGRFITTDPTGGDNVYIYTRNNPLKYVDPSGMMLMQRNAAIFDPSSDDPYDMLRFVDVSLTLVEFGQEEFGNNENLVFNPSSLKENIDKLIDQGYGMEVYDIISNGLVLDLEDTRDHLKKYVAEKDPWVYSRYVYEKNNPSLEVSFEYSVEETEDYATEEKIVGTIRVIDTKTGVVRVRTIKKIGSEYISSPWIVIDPKEENEGKRLGASQVTKPTGNVKQRPGEDVEIRIEGIEYGPH